MLRFLIFLTKRGVSILSILSVLIIISITIQKTPIYFDKSKNDFFHFKNVDIAIFGHSQSLGGINQFIIEKKSNNLTQNFSVLAAPLFYTCKRIQNFLKYNNKAVIFIELGTNQVDSKGTLKNMLNTNNSSPFINQLKQHIFLLNFEELLFFFRYDFKLTIISILKAIFTPIHMYNGIGFNDSLIEKALSNKEKIKSEIYSEWSFKTEDIQIGINELVNTIRNNPDRSFKIISLPEHSFHIKSFDNESEFSKVKLVLSKINNVEIYDLRDMNFPDDSFYRDFNHLSTKGMNKITKYMLEKKIIE